MGCRRKRQWLILRQYPIIDLMMEAVSTNVDKLLRDYAPQQPVTRLSSSSPPREPEISHASVDFHKASDISRVCVGLLITVLELLSAVLSALSSYV
jgi:hypothetical protein